MKKVYLLLSLSLSVVIPALGNLPSPDVKPEKSRVEQIQLDEYKLRWHERILLRVAERKLQRKSEKMGWALPVTDCDTLVLTNGQTYLVQIIKTDASQVQFVICDTVQQGKNLTTPWSQIKYIRRVNGEVLTAPAPQLVEVLMKEAKAVRLMGLLSIPLLLLFGLGAILGIIAIIKGRRLLKKARDYDEVRRVAKVGIIAGWISIAVLIAFFILVLTYYNA